jgi:large subunit ribosomal protein L23
MHRTMAASAARRATDQFRMWMPTMPLTMVSARNATARHPAFAIFRTVPRMTKHEIKEYLTKIYNLPVKSVNTMNYEGKRKRIMTSHKIHYFKYKDFKKAVVTFDESLRDVGLGMSVPELEEEQEAAQMAEDSSGSKP